MIATSQPRKFWDLIFVLDVKDKESPKGLNFIELALFRAGLIIDLVSISILSKPSNRVLQGHCKT